MLRLIESDPNDLKFYYGYGEILLMFKDYNRAIKQFEVVLKKDPNFEFAYIIFIKLGKTIIRFKYDSMENST